MISTMEGPQSEREAGPGARGGGWVMMPWAEMRVVRERKCRKCILLVFL